MCPLHGMFCCTFSVPARLLTTIGWRSKLGAAVPARSTTAVAPITRRIHVVIMMSLSSALMDAHHTDVGQGGALIEQRRVDAERVTAVDQTRIENRLTARRARRTRTGDTRVADRRRAVGVGPYVH